MADTNFDKVLAALVEPCAEEEKEQVDTYSEEETGLYNDDRYDDEDEYYDDEDDYDDDEEGGYYLWDEDTHTRLYNQIRDLVDQIRDDFEDYEYDEEMVGRIENLLIDARDALESLESVTDNDWCCQH